MKEAFARLIRQPVVFMLGILLFILILLFSIRAYYKYGSQTDKESDAQAVLVVEQTSYIIYMV